MSDIGDAVKAARQQAADMNDVLGMMSVPEQADGAAIVERAARIVSQLAIPFDRPADDEDAPDAHARAFAMLVAFERHGAGLVAHDRDAACAPGDLVIGDALTMWLVQSVDKDGKATRLIGAAPDDGEALVLRWVPDPQPRAWTTPERPASPALGAAPAAILSALVGLWGETRAGQRSLALPGALLAELARQKGVTIDLAGLERDADGATLAAWLRAHNAHEPGDGAEAAAGDICWSESIGAVGLVLRATPGAFDLLLPGGDSAGPLDEPADAVRIMRADAPAADDLWWRPA
ncbi:hypothetical protein U1839_00995 [Sphingomonas sp. RT2P30]|uniref:hypothetical protein n=1 Tax=Parasphingomonas halimpatiens TaxID=3096162 RepID=UPI002FC96BD6